MKKLVFGINLLCMLGFIACKDKKTDTPEQQNVYILTNEQGSNNNTIAKVFKNGMLVYTLGDGATFKVFAEDLEVSGNDIYVLGVKSVNATSTTTAVIYKNGVELQTIPFTPEFGPNCLAISGNDIYVCGRGNAPAGGVGARTRLWKNGTISDITNGMSSDARPWDMIVNGNDVYIAGFIQTTTSRKACYWKNGTIAYFDTTTVFNNSEAHRIAVSGNDVYASGFNDNKASIWKNTTRTQLNSLNGFSYGIFLNGTDVYAASTFNNGTANQAAYWKNGTQVTLSNSSWIFSYVYGIGVVGTDVYVIGSAKETNASMSKAVYWKNGVENVLATNSNFAEAYRIVVK